MGFGKELQGRKPGLVLDRHCSNERKAAKMPKKCTSSRETYGRRKDLSASFGFSFFASMARRSGSFEAWAEILGVSWSLGIERTLLRSCDVCAVFAKSRRWHFGSQGCRYRNSRLYATGYPSCVVAMQGTRTPGKQREVGALRDLRLARTTIMQLAILLAESDATTE